MMFTNGVGHIQQQSSTNLVISIAVPIREKYNINPTIRDVTNLNIHILNINIVFLGVLYHSKNSPNTLYDATVFAGAMVLIIFQMISGTLMFDNPTAYPMK